MPKTHVTIPFFIPHSGCRHRCVFCNQIYTSNTRFLPNEEYIVEKIEQYLQTIKPGVNHIEVAFFGGSFTGLDEAIQQQYLAIAYTYLSLHKIDGIRLSTRPDYINHKTLTLLREYGVTTVELGAQSMHDDVLQQAQRGHTVHDILNASKLIKEYGFNLIIQLMPGLPCDSFEKSIETARKTVLLYPDGVRIYPTVVIKDTQLETLYKENKFIPLSLDEAIAVCAFMYDIFTSNNIPVIRMGLHPFDDAVADTIIAGPYHPSFGYLVKSRYLRNKLENNIKNFLQNNGNIQTLTIKLPQNKSAEYYGPHKENIAFLRNVFHTITLQFYSADVQDLEIYG
ncbi:MAG TPA: radical SAM protein [Spirochaetota bacterium]|nr:radical SAM protein [Spirochaetota bacterium]HPP50332.1 radical SAM protein [Spirochaetota bacterium]